MKRCWFGLGLLTILLIGTALITWHMDKAHQPMVEATVEAGQRAIQNDWGNAEALINQARVQWKRNWGINAAFADHEPMEEINGLFAQLDIYCQLCDSVGFAAVCGRLSQSLEAMGDAHSFTWWNVF